MFVVRPITLQDTEEYESFAFSAIIGMTNLPKSKILLNKKIEASLEAFRSEIISPKNEEYTFVLENTVDKRLEGTSGIFSKSGVKEPNYSYKIEEIIPKATDLPVPKQMRILRVQAQRNGPSELCSIFLKPEFRKSGLGRLLSLSRLLFIACFPQRFDEMIRSELRGISNDITSPFWEGLGRKFLNMDFTEIIVMLEKGKRFVSDILPKYPIYVDLLSKETKDAIANVDSNTRPALQMLKEEGLEFNDEIYFTDGGPIVTGKTAELRTIKQSIVSTVKETPSQVDADQFIICNNRIDFRACFGSVKIIPHTHGNVCIPAEVADALQIKIGEQIRFVKPKAGARSQDSGVNKAGVRSQDSGVRR